MAHWQPIESAPTDGDDVLLCEADAEGFAIKIGWWDGDRWNINEPFADEWNWTHWMPLPLPPSPTPYL